MDWSIIVIIGLYVLYYFLIFIDQKKFITQPKEIIVKFLAIVFLYAGISLIYYSITGQPLLTNDPKVYNVYIFIIGFIALLWTIPFLIKDFKFYNRFFIKNEKELKLKTKKN